MTHAESYKVNYQEWVDSGHRLEPFMAAYENAETRLSDEDLKSFEDQYLARAVLELNMFRDFNSMDNDDRRHLIAWRELIS